MRKTLFLTLLFFSMIPLHGQIAVESFRLLENDLTAITSETQETDQNNEVAALIKVVTTQQGFTFDGGMLGIVKTVQKPAEIWVYVPKKLQKITIAHPELGILRDYYFQIPIESGRTYELKLVSGQVITTVKKTSTTQYLTIKVTPPNAAIYLDGELQAMSSEGEFYKLVTIGRHTYRVEAIGYKSQAGIIEVKSEKTDPLVIELQSQMATLMLNCGDEEAEIIVNDVVRGKGSWTGQVPAGPYVIEARHVGYVSTFEEVTVEELEERHVTLNAPSAPVYSTLRVESNPMGASVLIDGKTYGVTPCLIDESAKLLVGSHELKLILENYDIYTDTIDAEEETTLPTIQLSQSFTSVITSKPNAELFIDGKSVGETPYTGIFLLGDYRMKLTCEGYEPLEKTVHLTPTNPNQAFKLQRKLLRSNTFYVGTEASFGSMTTINAVLGGYFHSINAEVCFGYPIGATETAYFNYPQADGNAGEYHTLNISTPFQIEGLVGYGLTFGKRFRLTPCVGVRNTPIKGKTTDGLWAEQETYVLSGIGMLKVEFAVLPILSLVVSPEFAAPFGKDAFINTFEPVCPTMAKWYGGFNINAGIHFNF